METQEKRLDILHKEIDLIQSCIKKYDDRSLMIKGWSIALVGLIVGLNSSSILIFHEKATPVALSLLLMLNFLLYTIDVHNQKKKWQYVQLYRWTIANRKFDDQPWKHVYSLDYTRFENSLGSFKLSVFSKTVYNTLWFFILALMIWHLIVGFEKSKEEKTPQNNVQSTL